MKETTDYTDFADYKDFNLIIAAKAADLLRLAICEIGRLRQNPTENLCNL
jgi:hypothetical protein